jgi:hypothetical protein
MPRPARFKLVVTVTKSVTASVRACQAEHAHRRPGRGIARLVTATVGLTGSYYGYSNRVVTVTASARGVGLSEPGPRAG